MKYEDMLAQARAKTAPFCNACPVCDGQACRNRIPGPGAKGSGLGAVNNYKAWQRITVNMDLINPSAPIDTSWELFGRRMVMPIMAGPVGAVKMHYGPAYDDVAYNDILVAACAAEGIAAFTGDGSDPNVMVAACQAIAKVGGAAIPTIKPWDDDTIKTKMDLAIAANAMAVAMDIDAAGLPFLKNHQPPAGPKTVAQLRRIIALADRPFIIKGVMTTDGARKAVEAGAAAIVVSNHGGRVQDGVPATATVLPAIAAAVKGSGIKVLVDGGIRSGLDVFRALALGADGVLIARPFVTSVYGGQAEGVRCLLDRLAGELADTMLMCGARQLSDISPAMVEADMGRC